MEVNNSIKCGVHDCKHHAGNVEYCTLNCVSIGACECSPKTKEGTDCESFAARETKKRAAPITPKRAAHVYQTMRNTLREFLKLSRPLHSVSVVAKQAPLALSNAKVSCKHEPWLVARVNKASL